MKFDDYVNLLKEELLQRLVKSSSTWLISQFAFLGWGPLGPLLNMVLTKFLGFLINESEMAAFFLYIDIRVDKQGQEFYDSLERKFIAQNGGDPDAIKEAEKDTIDKFRNLIILSN